MTDQKPLVANFLTDEELLTQELRLIGRPDQDASLSRDRPSTDATVWFDSDYDVTPPEVKDRHKISPYVWCAFCQRRTHWRGWRARDVDTGRTFLVGRNCAERHGGDNIARAANAFDARVERRDALLDRLDFLDQAPSMVSTIESIAASPSIKAVGAWRAILARLCNRASMRELQHAAQAALPILFAHTSQRDLARRASDGMVPITRLPSPALYAEPVPGPTADRLATAAKEGLRVLQRDTKLSSTSQLRDAIRAIREGLTEAERLAHMFADVADGLTNDAVDGLMLWGRTPGGGRFENAKRVGRHVIWKPKHGPEQSAAIPTA